ncbi:MAG: acyl-CoA dehydrogenase family protein [Candidatus Niyogibacteria bacterium]|nr:acyl-CoA dehydrogenase family protein [Candidatus Niyogibacteria bacterium]
MPKTSSAFFNKLGKGVQIAEEHRDASVNKGFVASLFEGAPNFNLLFPWPEQNPEDAQKEAKIISDLKEFLESKIEPDIIHGKKDITLELIEAMADFGLFKLKVPEKYGGLGLSQTTYTHVIALLSAFCPSIGIMISADNTIGAKFSVLNYGTPEQISLYLPALMKWPSAFCFTEKEVGSDPARMRTYALRLRDQNGKVVGYKIYGEKWYATNSVWRTGEPLAEYLAVVAKILDLPEDLDNSKKGYCFGVFIVPNASEKLNRVAIIQRARFMGMPGIFNGILSFNGVEVDNRALVGGEGNGFKIALRALNTGRISIAGSCVANSKKCLKIMNWWAKTRWQWGAFIGEKELIGSGMLVPAVVRTFAMEAITDYAAGLADRKQDCRLEAAICKVIASEWGWKIMDDAMQLRGGRGYESFESLAPREQAPSIDQMFTDNRPNRIFEGSTQILSQYVIREGLDNYLKRGEPFLDKGNLVEKISAVIGFAWQYFKLSFSSRLPDNLPRQVRSDFKFVEKNARKLARAIIIYSAKHRDQMVNKQLMIDRLFWIAAELFLMAAVWSFALKKQFFDSNYSDPVMELAKAYCRAAKRRIKHYFASLRDNDDASAKIIAKNLLNNRYDFIQKGIIN